MSYDQAPESPVTAEQARAVVQAFIDERSADGLQMAEAFTALELVDGVLTATWNEEAIGKEMSDILLASSPFENLAAWLGTPLSFENEQGRQVRQHVDTVRVEGPFGAHSMSARELYERGTGLRADQP